MAASDAPVAKKHVSYADAVPIVDGEHSTPLGGRTRRSAAHGARIDCSPVRLQHRDEGRNTTALAEQWLAVSPEDLTDALRARVRGAERHRALALAYPRTATERAWRLICLGVALHQNRDYEGSLKALDAAVSLRPEPRAVRAAYLCAVAVHRDRGDYEAALRVSRSIPD